MTDDRALLEAVLASPRDDAPRLIFADWLEEHGQEERARFVRWQCMNRRSVLTCDYNYVFGTATPEPDVPKELEGWFLDHVYKLMNPYQGPYVCGLVFVWYRGFVCRVAMPADDAFARLGSLLADWPITTVIMTAPLRPENRSTLLTVWENLSTAGRETVRRAKPGWAKPGWHPLNLLYPSVRFRERFTGYRLPEGFRSVIAVSMRPEVNIWEVGAP